MVRIIRKAALPSPSEVPETLRAAAAHASMVRLRHTVTDGAFKGFTIGDDKERVFARVRQFGIRGKDWTIGVKNGGASSDDGAIMASDLWEVETKESSHGVFYDFRFVSGRLVEIRYTRPRLQVN
jgi:hypothetical protein